MPETNVAIPDINAMSVEELEALVRKPDDQIVAPVAATPPEQNTNIVPAEPLPAAPGPDEKRWIEIKNDEGTVNLRFRNEDEVAKSLLHSQEMIKRQKETIDRLNAERGELGQYKTEYEEAVAEKDRLANYIAELEATRSKIQTGQQPTVAGAQALESLTLQPGQDQSQALLAEIQNLRNGLLEVTARTEQVEGKYQQAESVLKQKEQELVASQGVQGLYSEVNSFSKNHPEYQTSQPFEKLDEIVSKYGEEEAKALISPDDFEKYTATMELVGLYKNSPEGEFDIARKNFQDLDEAYVLKLHRSGELGKSIANAHKAGVQNLEQALNRSAQSATVLPNNLASRNNGTVTMGPSEIKSILEMDPAQVNASPELRKQFDEAVKRLGINLTAMEQ